MSKSPAASAWTQLRSNLPPDESFVGRRLRVTVGLAVAAAVVVVDQATKAWADRALVPGRTVEVLGDRLGWQLTFNDGGAWGFPAPSWFFLAVTVIVVVIVVRNLPEVVTGRAATAYGLLLAGAVGNAIDRVLRTGDPGDPRYFFGHVVDFVAVELPTWLGPLGGDFPRFNVADAAITIGFVLLAWDLVREPTEHPDRPDPEVGDADRSEQATALPVSIS